VFARLTGTGRVTVTLSFNPPPPILAAATSSIFPLGEGDICYYHFYKGGKINSAGRACRGKFRWLKTISIA